MKHHIGLGTAHEMNHRATFFDSITSGETRRFPDSLHHLISFWLHSARRSTSAVFSPARTAPESARLEWRPPLPTPPPGWLAPASPTSPAQPGGSPRGVIPPYSIPVSL